MQSSSRKVRRIRQGILFAHPKTPKTVDDIPRRIPNAYAKTQKGEPWLIWDSKCADRMLMFGRLRVVGWKYSFYTFVDTM